MITTQNISKKYGDFTAVNHLSLEVKPGEILCLLGANGAGKSTTINMLLHFIEPTSGTASINGLEVAKHPLKTKQHLKCQRLSVTARMRGNMFCLFYTLLVSF